jgi:hypothetical protein
MRKRQTFLMVIWLLALAGVALAQSGIPDLTNSEIWMAYDGPGTPSLMVIPNGSGLPFTEARLEDGTVVDATVFLKLMDWGDYPIYMFPLEDMWLESLDGGMHSCNGGTTADVHTDEEGITYWAQPLRAGGFSQAPMGVFVNGDNLSLEGLPLSINSPDITGDGNVTLHDVSAFAQDLYGTYDFRSDLHRDGVINLSDVGRLVFGLQAACP